MEIWQTQELFAYWDEHPPAHVMLDRLYDLIVIVSGNKPRPRKNRSSARTMSRGELKAQGIPKAKKAARA